jgi:hypothetical protein
MGGPGSGRHGGGSSKAHKTPGTFSIDLNKMKKAKLPARFKGKGGLDKFSPSMMADYKNWVHKNWGK